MDQYFPQKQQQQQQNPWGDHQHFIAVDPLFGHHHYGPDVPLKRKFSIEDLFADDTPPDQNYEPTSMNRNLKLHERNQKHHHMSMMATMKNDSIEGHCEQSFQAQAPGANMQMSMSLVTAQHDV